jgi:hypothetical protein
MTLCVQKIEVLLRREARPINGLSLTFGLVAHQIGVRRSIGHFIGSGLTLFKCSSSVSGMKYTS